MATYYNTKCPNCGVERLFSKWEPGYQEFGNLTCDECGCTYNDRSGQIVSLPENENKKI